MQKTVRIKANVGQDTVLHADMRRDIKTLEVLSLKIGQEGVYPRDVSNYGVVVGRVLANNAYGVPNAKVSVFVPFSNDSKRIESLYPFKNVSSKDGENIRYNLLQNLSDDPVHRDIGTFPTKRLVLDNDAEIEVYDKYWRYTTVTNNSGDYMIFGVPCGVQTIHSEVDLSDVGILSQTPQDMIFKGYNINQFESPSQFKSGTNLDNLAQVISQNTPVNVYPYWGDNESTTVAITRCDINVAYDFTPTCVFMGSVVADGGGHGMDSSCMQDKSMGDNGKLIGPKGRIEMIRKNVYGGTEKYDVGNSQVIDDNGVFCYQIPMNLDFIGTDEYGNIVRMENSDKGIPTRACVRFRVSVSANSGNGSMKHAKYLIPNNPRLLSDSGPKVDEGTFSEYYEFGELTPDECFKNLYWNKVYSVKNYIPRLILDEGYGNGIKENELLYSCLKNPTAESGINPIPFNHIRIDESPLKEVANDTENGVIESIRDFDNENEVVKFDFYNDWLNGCLYFPLWETNSFIAEIQGAKRIVNKFCNCKNKASNLHIVQNGLISYGTGGFVNLKPNTIKFTGEETINGVIMEKANDDNEPEYYYSCGNSVDGGNVKVLYATDIISLGSIKDNDGDLVPKFFTSIPPSTCNMPSTWCATYDEAKTVEGEDAETVVTAKKTVKSGILWERTDTEIEKNERNGLFCGMSANMTLTLKVKSFINAERACELGVTYDKNLILSVDGNENAETNGVDGMITRQEIADNDTRSIFASLNYGNLNDFMADEATTYWKNKYDYLPLVEFDGRLSKYAPLATSDMAIKTYDSNDENYMRYRFGKNRHFYESGIPLFENSFYFYFGIKQGLTAIDKLIEGYDNPIVDDKKEPFSLSFTVHSPSPCEDADGSMEIVIGNIASPYSYKLLRISDNEVVAYEDNCTVNMLQITGLTAGGYRFTVTDRYGRAVSKRIAVPYPSFKTQYRIFQYDTNDKTDEYYNGWILFDSIEYDGGTYEVINLEFKGHTGSTYSFSITAANGEETITCYGYLESQEGTMESDSFAPEEIDDTLALRYKNAEGNEAVFIMKIVFVCGEKESTLHEEGDVIFNKLRDDELQYEINGIPMEVLCDGINTEHSTEWDEEHSADELENEFYYSDDNSVHSLDWWNVDEMMLGKINADSIDLRSKWKYLESMCKAAFMYDDNMQNAYTLSVKQNDGSVLTDTTEETRMLSPDYSQIYNASVIEPILGWSYSKYDSVIGNKACANIISDNIVSNTIIGPTPLTRLLELAEAPKESNGGGLITFASPQAKNLRFGVIKPSPIDYIPPSDPMVDPGLFYNPSNLTSDGWTYKNDIATVQDYATIYSQMKTKYEAANDDRTYEDDNKFGTYLNPYIGNYVIINSGETISYPINGNYMGVSNRYFGSFNGKVYDSLKKTTAPYGLTVSEILEDEMNRSNGEFIGELNDDALLDIYQLYENKSDGHYPFFKTMFVDKRMDYDIVMAIPPIDMSPEYALKAKMIGFLANGNPMAYYEENGKKVIADTENVSMDGQKYKTSYVVSEGNQVKKTELSAVTRYIGTTINGSKLFPYVQYKNGDGIMVHNASDSNELTKEEFSGTVLSKEYVNEKMMDFDGRRYHLLRKYDIPLSKDSFRFQSSSFAFGFSPTEDDAKYTGDEGEKVTFEVPSYAKVNFYDERGEVDKPEFIFTSSGKAAITNTVQICKDIRFAKAMVEDAEVNTAENYVTKSLFFCDLNTAKEAFVKSSTSDEDKSTKEVYEKLREKIAEHKMVVSPTSHTRLPGETGKTGFFFSDTAFDKHYVQDDNSENYAFSTVSPLEYLKALASMKALEEDDTVHREQIKFLYQCFMGGLLTRNNVDDIIEEATKEEPEYTTALKFYELGWVHPLCFSEDGAGVPYYDNNDYYQRYFYSDINNIDAHGFSPEEKMKIDFNKMMVIGSEREFMFSTSDKLLRKVTTLSFGQTYDLRNIHFATIWGQFLDTDDETYSPLILDKNDVIQLSSNGGTRNVDALMLYAELDEMNEHNENHEIMALDNTYVEIEYYAETSGETYSGRIAGTLSSSLTCRVAWEDDMTKEWKTLITTLGEFNYKQEGVEQTTLKTRYIVFPRNQLVYNILMWLHNSDEYNGAYEFTKASIGLTLNTSNARYKLYLKKS